MLINKSIICVGSMVTVTLVAGAFLSSFNVSADDDAIDNVTVTVPVSCSMEGTGMNSHNASIVNGTYQADIGSTTLKVFCNDNNGFAIYAIGFTDDEYGKTVLTNTTLGSTADIVTGTATSGNTSNWAMKLAAPSSPTPTYPLTLDNSFGSYHVVPAEYTKVAHRDSATDIGTSAEGSTLTTTYAAFMSQTQPAGTYIGQVRYTLVHPNGETPITPITIEDAYARAGKQKINDYYTIQDMNPIICGIVNQYNSSGMASVIDTRDNNIYKIAKLVDENCWMLNNLALDPTISTTASNMNENNTNATATAINNYLNGGSNTTGYSNVAVRDVDSNFNSFIEPMINNASKDTLVTSFGPGSNSGQDKVGIYYNFCAATVGTHCYAQGNSIESTVAQDICPTGWRLPIAWSGNSDYYGLGMALGIAYYGEDGVFYGDKAIDYVTSLSTTLSGQYYQNSPRYQNSIGYWWSSSATGSFNITLRLDYYDNNDFNIYDGYGVERTIGSTIRCIANHDSE